MVSGEHPVYPGGPLCQPNCPGPWSMYHDGYADGYERGEQCPDRCGGVVGHSGPHQSSDYVPRSEIEAEVRSALLGSDPIHKAVAEIIENPSRYHDAGAITARLMSVWGRGRSPLEGLKR